MSKGRGFIYPACEHGVLRGGWRMQFIRLFYQADDFLVIFKIGN